MEPPDPDTTVLRGTQKVGTRLRCPECSSELIVVNGGDAVLSCCGRPPDPVKPPTR